MPRTSQLILVLKLSPFGFTAILLSYTLTFFTLIETTEVYELSEMTIKSQLIIGSKGLPTKPSSVPTKTRNATPLLYLKDRGG